MYNVDFVGLACFSKQDGKGRLVLLPDGRDPGPDIDAHVPRLVVRTTSIEHIDTSLKRRSTVKGSATVIELPQCELEFEGADTDDRTQIDLDTSDQEPFIQRLVEVDSNFVAADNDAQTVVKVRIRRGRLRAFRHPDTGADDDDPAVISQLQVPHDGTITVTVTPKGARRASRVRLKAETEIVLANTSDKPTRETTGNHFQLYERLSQRPVNFSVRPARSIGRLKKLPNRNPFFAVTGPVGTSGDCGNTGCCP